MKVTFACEECGDRLPVSWTKQDADSLSHNAAELEKDCEDGLPGYLNCRRCARLTYGPLTEEMVAEALCEAKTNGNTGVDGEDWAHWHEIREDTGNVRDSFRHEARFVLRLLIDGGLANDKPTATRGCSAEDWRDWLLDLARQT